MSQLCLRRFVVFVAVGFALVGIGACGRAVNTTEAFRTPLPTATPVTPTPTPRPTVAPTVAPATAPTAGPTETPQPALAALAQSARGLRAPAVLPRVIEQLAVEVRSADHPDARLWPDQLLPYVDAVATAAGPFRYEAATVELVDAQQMAQQMELDIPALERLSDPAAEAVLRYDDVHRALGIATIDFDVLASNRATARQIQGLYDQAQHRILLRSSSLDDELSVDEQQLLVHEIVHAWQGPSRVRELAAISRDQTVAGALIEGEAERIADDWRAEQTELDQATSVVADGERQAASLIADTRVRYALGRRLHTALDRLGGVDELLSTGTVVDGRALVDPYGWIDEPTIDPMSFGAPRVAGVTPLLEIALPLSAPHWLQIFASANDFPTALEAARAVTSSSATTVWIDETGTACIAVLLAGDIERLGEALAAWQAAAPSHRIVGPTNEGTRVEACDPGVGAVPVPVVAADEAVRRAGQVIDGEGWALARGNERAFGVCRVHHLASAGSIDSRSRTADILQALEALDPTVCA